MRIFANRAIGLLLVVSPALAARGLAGSLTLQPESRVWIQGTSNVRNFECTATSLDVQVETSGGSGAVQRIAAGEKAIETVVVTVPAKGLDCDNSKMNEHMLKALKAADHPAIEFHLSSYDLARDSTGMQAVLNGTLKLGGTEKPVTLTAAVRPDSDDVLHVTGAYELRMTDFGLKPPTLMLGAFKVHDPVKVNFDLRLKD
jgi:polyisoprenoid-binding protein YceI